ncbi:hypothetical protein [Cytobacillus oceanisediminis]|uniref:hypothetical protein n=1 Tax=Cytobacillus oceanisediminis TaxID=665099 RepID=UPI001FB3B339|nr:hypothetical protein [Cytobacillus oceanisediminis]UOE55278.1 hypothetical protein IRB79_26535 [Cytobacillus oceanisediminis]
MMPLRTEEAEIRESESELDAPSDRRSRNPRERVRTCSSFGQKKQESERVSPNLMPLRTGEAEIRESESELDAPSDRRSRNTRRKSPNLMPLQTGEAEIRAM